MMISDEIFDIFIFQNTQKFLFLKQGCTITNKSSYKKLEIKSNCEKMPANCINKNLQQNGELKPKSSVVVTYHKYCWIFCVFQHSTTTHIIKLGYGQGVITTCNTGKDLLELWNFGVFAQKKNKERK